MRQTCGPWRRRIANKGIPLALSMPQIREDGKIRLAISFADDDDVATVYFTLTVT
jgi:hypothetical protein